MDRLCIHTIQEILYRTLVVGELCKEPRQAIPGRFFDADHHPILDPRKSDHEGSYAFGVMVGVGGNGSVMPECPRTDGPHVGWDPGAVKGNMALDLGPAEGQTIVELSGTKWVTGIK